MSEISRPQGDASPGAQGEGKGHGESKGAGTSAGEAKKGATEGIQGRGSETLAQGEPATGGEQDQQTTDAVDKEGAVIKQETENSDGLDLEGYEDDASVPFPDGEGLPGLDLEGYENDAPLQDESRSGDEVSELRSIDMGDVLAGLGGYILGEVRNATVGEAIKSGINQVKDRFSKRNSKDGRGDAPSDAGAGAEGASPSANGAGDPGSPEVVRNEPQAGPELAAALAERAENEGDPQRRGIA